MSSTARIWAHAELSAAVDALVKRNPAMNREANHRRLLGTLQLEMSQPEGARLGIGDLDDVRLQQSIDLIVRTKQLPRALKADEIFSRAFLPPLPDRVRDLARGA